MRDDKIIRNEPCPFCGHGGVSLAQNLDEMEIETPESLRASIEQTRLRVAELRAHIRRQVNDQRDINR